MFVGDYENVLNDFLANNIYTILPSDCIFEELCDMPADNQYFSDNKIMEVFDLLSDEKSREIYGNVLAQRMALPLAKRSFRDMNSDDEYFQVEVVKLTDEEIFCDCGAYTGDTMERFLRVVDGKCKYIYAYEMAKDNFIKLGETAKRMEKEYISFSQDNYRLINAGVWHQHDMIAYGKEEAGTGESYGVFKTDNMMYAEAVTIDETTDLPVTFIKMDIEGAEMNALRGAAKQIKTNRPKLAICLYHRLADFWEIPLYIKTLNPDYNLYVRHHGNSIGGTVLYAV